MCMLCVIPPNTIPSRDKLENSALNNPDGFGFAIVIPEENRIHVERTMNADESINNFLALREKYQTGYAMWHARLATHGTTDVSNCHPFMVGDEQTYLAHNGVLGVLYDTKTDTRSDTRIFAEDVIAKMGVSALDNEQIWNVLEDFTQGSKVCILTLDKRAKHQMYLFHQDSGTIDESGVWWSNDSCNIGYTRWYSSKNYTWFGDEYDDYDYVIGAPKKDKQLNTSHVSGKDYACVACQALYESEEMERIEWICAYCHTCQLCDTDKTSCLCYRPKDKGYSRKIYDLSEMPDVLAKEVETSHGWVQAGYNFETHGWYKIDYREDSPASYVQGGWAL